MLGQTVQYKNEEFILPEVGPLGGGPAPSRKREEREAMQNLRRRVAPHHLARPRNPTPQPDVNSEPEPEPEPERERERPNNDKPSLLQRVNYF